MRLTKLEHAAFVLEKSDKKLFVDPGSLTIPITDAEDAVGIVITHEHADHWTPDQLNRIFDMAPGIPIFAPQGVALAAEGFEVVTVQDGDVIECEPFTMQFFGQEHAVIHSSIPVVENVGVLINETIFYPGDAFTVPDNVAVDVLAVPAGAPWLKIGEVIDYVETISPQRSFPTHEMGLSVAGKMMAYARIREATEKVGGQFFELHPGDPLDL